MVKEITIKFNDIIKDESKDIDLKPMVTLSEKCVLIKDEGLNVELIKEEPDFQIEDEAKDWNISKTVFEEVPRDGSIEHGENISAPWPLSIDPSEVKEAGFGVWTVAKLPRGLTFGPYEERVLYKNEDKANLRMCVDIIDMSMSNWLHFANCSRTFEEANLAVFQYKGQIYYKTVTEINRDAELLVWHSDKPGSVFTYGLENYKEMFTSPVKETKVSCMKISSSKVNLLRRYSSAEMEQKNSPVIQVFLNLNKISSNDNIFNDSHPKINEFIDNRHKKIVGRENDVEYTINSYICFECDREFGRSSSLTRHFRIHSGEKPYKCSQCDKAFSQSDSLKKHLHIHSGEKPYNCSHCDKTFTRLDHLKMHLRIHSEEKPYKCTHCDKAFKQSGNLKAHFRIHSGEKPYKCSKCNKAFTVSSDMKRHLRIHTGEKYYKCAQCDKAFSQSGSLKIHFRIHSGESIKKRYKCTQCEKAFTESIRLKSHLRVHSGEKPYSCSHCEKVFAESSTLKKHLRIHSGEKPYKCSQCDKAFTSSFALKRHLRVHSGEKPYNCSHCDKVFTESGSLKRHLRIHSREELYKCSQCDKAFTSSFALKRHLKIHNIQ